MGRVGYAAGKVKIKYLIRHGLLLVDFLKPGALTVDKKTLPIKIPWCTRLHADKYS